MSTRRDWLVHCRLAKGWTQQEASERLDVETSTLSRWETGRRTPSLRSWQAISAVYDLPTEVVATQIVTERLLLARRSEMH